MTAYLVKMAPPTNEKSAFDIITKSDSYPLYKLLLIVFFIAFVASVVTLYSFNIRIVEYYFIIVLMVLAILCEILLFEPTPGRQLTMLVQIIITYLDIVWGTTLNYYFFIGQTDIIAHSWIAQTLVIFGHVTPIFDLYQPFPQWHIFTASTYLISGLQVPMYKIMCINCGIILACAGIPGIYVIAHKLTGSKRTSMLASLFLSVFPTYIFYGMYSIPRSIVPVFMILVVILLLGRNDSRKYLVALFLILTITMFHTVSIVFVVSIFILIFALQRLFAMDKKDYLITFNFLLLSIAIWLIYWVVNGQVMFEQLYLSIVSQAPTGFLTKTALTMPLNELFNYLQFSVFLLFIIIGVLITLRTKASAKLKIFSIMALLLIPLAFPGPLLLINKLAANFDIGRFDEYSSLFMGLISAIGFLALYNKAGRNIKVLVVIVFALLVFLAISNDFVATDNPLIKRTFYTDYLSFGEVTGADNMYNNSNGFVMGDYILTRFYQAQLDQGNKSHTAEVDYYNNTLMRRSTNNSSDIFVIRNGELKKRPLELFTMDNDTYDPAPAAAIDYYDLSTGVYNNLTRYNRVYNSSVMDGYL